MKPHVLLLAALAFTANLVTSATNAGAVCPEDFWSDTYPNLVKGYTDTKPADAFIPISEFEPTGTIGPGWFQCMHFPRGFSTSGYLVHVTGDYDVTIDVLDGVGEAGAKYRVWVDGYPLPGYTQPVGTWGVVDPLKVGQPRGSFQTRLCTGDHSIRAQELSMSEHHPDNVCEMAMANVGIGLTLHY